jgi:uncharacterized membrane protein YfcA
MSYEQDLIFVAVVAAAGYFQTVTGFGFGMIILGAMTGLGYLPIPITAAIVNLLAVVNCVTALPGRLEHLDTRLMSWILIGLLPAIPAGLLLLSFLSATAAQLLQGLLGILVIYGGISVVRRTGAKANKSPNWSFFLAGAGSGLCGGLFGASGPPLIYQLYRQPIALVSIRNMLILMFAVTSSTRAFILAVTGQLDTTILELAAIALPTVVLATFVGRRLPPPLSPRAMRGVVCVMLVGIGCQLLGSAI